MTSENIQNDLHRGCVLIQDFVQAKMTTVEFLQAFDNLYYTLALDGHEGGTAYISRSPVAVSLIRTIQLEIINLLAPEGADASYFVAGRIPMEMARNRIIEICCHMLIRMAVDETLAATRD